MFFIVGAAHAVYDGGKMSVKVFMVGLKMDGNSIVSFVLRLFCGFYSFIQFIDVVKLIGC